MQRLLNPLAWLLVAGFPLLSLLYIAARFYAPSDGMFVDPNRLPIITGEGVYITEIEARPGGLESGDRVVAVGGQKVDTWASHLVNPSYDRPEWRVGDKVDYEIVRDGEPQTITVTLIRYPLWTALKSSIGLTISLLLSYLIMLFVFVRRPEERAARVLAVVYAAYVATTFAVQGFSVQDFVNGYMLWLYRFIDLAFVFGVTLQAYFLLIFPIPHPFLKRRPYTVLGLLLIPNVLWIVTTAIYGFFKVNTLDWIIISYYLEAFFQVVTISIVIITGIMSYRLSRRDAVARQQWRWLSVSVVYVLVLLLIVWFIGPILTGQSLINANLFGLLVMPAPFILANIILRYRLWDIDIIINRSLVYGTVAGLVLVIFFLILVTLQIVLGQTRPLVALMISAAVTIPTFRTVRARVQRFVDRRIYKLRFDQEELQKAQNLLPAITNPGRLTGQNLQGYQVLGVLGLGGMGELYRGIDEARQLVAVKTLHPKLGDDPNIAARFKREAQIGMLLDHPNIARVLTMGEINDLLYLIMEFVEGNDLSHLIQQGSLAVEKTVEIAQQICAALTEVHQRGFVHRDLKPGNIMIRPDGTAVLLDFGVSKALDSSVMLTSTGAIGTIAYMAPEQIRTAQTVDHRADIYSLGVMLYEMLTGQKPFQGSSGQVLFGHLTRPAPDPRELNPNLSEGLVAVIWQAMAKNSADRFQSASEFADALMPDARAVYS